MTAEIYMYRLPFEQTATFHRPSKIYHILFIALLHENSSPCTWSQHADGGINTLHCANNNKYELIHSKNNTKTNALIKCANVSVLDVYRISFFLNKNYLVICNLTLYGNRRTTGEDWIMMQPTIGHRIAKEQNTTNL